MVRNDKSQNAGAGIKQEADVLRRPFFCVEKERHRFFPSGKSGPRVLRPEPGAR